MEINVKIEMPEKLNIWEGAEIENEEEAFEKLGKENVLKFQKEKLEELIEFTKSHIGLMLSDEEDFCVAIHEKIVSIEDWDSLEHWGIKFTISSN